MTGSAGVDEWIQRTTILVDVLRDVGVSIVGLVVLAAVVSLLVAVGYRWSTTRAPPAGASPFLGLATVACYLSYSFSRSGTFVDGVGPETAGSGAYLLTTFVLAGIVSGTGSQLGDRIAREVTGVPRIDADGDATAGIRSARLAVDVKLPDTVDDADGCRQVDTTVRKALANSTVRLPHDLSTEERKRRIEGHVVRDYDVDYADATMAEDGTVDRLIVGRRFAGLGSMLPPKTVAMAIRAVSAPDASLGDPIEIWSTGGTLIATGTLRTTNGAIATVIVDEDRASDLSPDERYRLLTRPDEATDGFEFASVLRSVGETIVSLSVTEDGPLDGEFVGWLPGRTIVIDRDGELCPLPEASETVQAGDDLWLLASPTSLSEFEHST